MLKITLDIEPVAKGRAIITYQNGRMWSFNPQKTQEAQDNMKAMLSEYHTQCFPPGIPLKLDVTFYRTKSKWLPKREILPFRRPDTDNLLKLALDAMNGIIISDDAQICTIIARKRWAKNGKGYITLHLSQDTDTENI